MTKKVTESGDAETDGYIQEPAVLQRSGPPDGGWGWMVVFGSFMIHIITDGVTYSFGVFYDEFLDYFKEGKGATAWILSILVGVTFCSGPISSILVNKWGCRTVTIMGSILASSCMVLSIWANSVFYLYFTIGIGTGLGFGLIYLPAIVSVSTYFESKRSLATGIAVCGSGFGTFIFAPIITTLLKMYGWRGAMLIIAGVVLSCCIFGALFKPLKQTENNPEVLIPLKSTEAETSLEITSSYSNAYLASSSGDAGNMQRAWSTTDMVHGKCKYGTIQKDKLHLITSTKSEGCPNCSDIHHSDYFRRSGMLYQSINNMSQSKIGGSTFITAIGETSEKEVVVVSGKKFFKNLIDPSICKDVLFILFAVSNFLTSIGFNIPYVYIVSKAKALGISSEQAGLLLSVIGVANTISRIILGYAADKPFVNRLLVYNVCLTLCGIATVLSCFCDNFITMAIYASVFGSMIGAYVGLTSVILVDLLGLDKLTNAFGILLLFQGIASLIGPPIAGSLYDWMHSYSPGFALAGITIGLSGVMLFSIPFIQKYRQHKSPATP